MIVASRAVERRPYRRASLPAVVIALAGLLVMAGCVDADLGRQAAVVLAGEKVQVADDEGWVDVAEGEQIADGARVRTGDEEAHLQVQGGEVRLAGHSIARVRRRGIDLIRGELLAESVDGYVVSWADTEVEGAGAYRLEGGVTPRVAVYDGAVEVRRFAESLDVPALRQVSLASQRITGAVEPLQYRDDDTWDRRLLSAAISFDNEVERLARGIDRAHGEDARSASFYETFVAVDAGTVPVLSSVSRVNGDDRFGPPSDALVTLFVARAVADVDDVDLERAVRDVTALRSAGARWGLIAVEKGVSTRQLAQVVDLAQERHLAEATDDDADASPSDGSAGSPGTAPSAPSDDGGDAGGGGDEPQPMPADEPADRPTSDDDTDDGPLDDDDIEATNALRDVIDSLVRGTLDPLTGDGGLLD